jgi:hypothetical protein
VLDTVRGELVQGNVKQAVVLLQRSTAWGLLVVYCVWNAWWILQLRIPPALFLAITGLPCPTTGGTHSMLCLLRGDWEESLRWNLLTIPIVVLVGFTLCCVGRCLRARQPVLLHRRFLFAWGALLAVAWACKLLGNSNYW